MNPIEFSIRKACSEDCPRIIELIKELRDYEKLSGGPQIDANTLKKDGFGEDKFFNCCVAETKDKIGDQKLIIGYVIYFNTYSTWEGRSIYMEDLYVTPMYRSKGVGTALWKSIVREALEKGCVRCDFSVLEWNKSSIEFYKNQGAIDLTKDHNWHLFRLQKAQMETFSKEKV